MTRRTRERRRENFLSAYHFNALPPNHKGKAVDPRRVRFVEIAEPAEKDSLPKDCSLFERQFTACSKHQRLRSDVGTSGKIEMGRKMSLDSQETLPPSFLGHPGHLNQPGPPWLPITESAG